MSEWIEWNGGDCPVDGDTVVEILISSGSIFKCRAKDCNWSHIGMCSDTIKYRILSASESFLEQCNTKAQVERENALENAVDCLIALCKANLIDISIGKDGSATAHTSFGDFGLKNKSSQDVTKLLECIKFVNEF